MRASLLALVAVTAAAAVAIAVAGSVLVAPSVIAIPEAALTLPHETITFPSESGSTIHGWYLQGSGKGAVVLMHGVRANRLAMVARAKLLNAAGYSVLLFDFQAHGESPGQYITMGYLEALDAEAAVAYVGRRAPNQFLAVIGVSLGGAAAVLGPRPLPVQALVLESVYPNIRAAVRNRLEMRVGPLAGLLSPLLLMQLKPRLGINIEDLSPERKIKATTAPVLIIAGAEDRHTTLKDTEALFRAAPSPKSLWVIPGAGHEDFAAYSPNEYKKRVLSFFGHEDGGLNAGVGPQSNRSRLAA